jgi:hypothetical protein
MVARNRSREVMVRRLSAEGFAAMAPPTYRADCNPSEDVRQSDRPVIGGGPALFDDGEDVRWTTR